MDGTTVHAALQRDPILRQICDVYTLEELDGFVRKEEVARPLAMVVNTDPSPEGPGEHWVAIYADQTKTEFFDSFANNPTRVGFYRLFNHLDQPWERNTRGLQDLFSIVCGHYCLYYLLQRSRGHRMKDIVQIFGSNTQENDALVERLVRRHFKVPRLTSLDLGP